MASHGVLVSCRVRDSNLEPSDQVVRIDSDSSSIVITPGIVGSGDAASSSSPSPPSSSCFSYLDSVFPSTATQTQVFNAIGRPFIHEVLAGYNCTILAYGQTGSGKTFTAVGGSTRDSRGLIPRSLELLLAQMLEISSREEVDASLTVSFVEIYQEKLRDLLLPFNTSRLRLREDRARGIWVQGAGSISIDSVETGMVLLERGTTQRSTGRTAMNAESSRSHSVLMLTFTKRRSSSAAGPESSFSSNSSTLSIVDLAGSERAEKTMASGVRLDEAKHINKSLSALGNVINALADGEARHVPYRDSVLTRLLQTSLGGNAKTHLVLTCSSSAAHVDETLSTLRFGARAKCVHNSPLVNLIPDDAGQSQRLLQILRDKVTSLGCYIRELEARKCSACSRRQLGHPDVDVPSSTSQPNFSCRREADQIDSNDLDGCMRASASSSAEDTASDVVIQSEMRSLRMALAELAVAAACNVSPPSQDTTDTCGHRNKRLLDLEARVDSLTIENEHLNAANRSLRLEVNRLNELLRQQDEGGAAETEILRRRLSSAESRLDGLRAELGAALRQHEECRVFLADKQREVSELCAAAVLLRPPSPVDPREEREGDTRAVTTTRKSVARPFTADELSSPPPRRHLKTQLESADQDAHTGVALNIQSWWRGGDGDASTSTRDRVSPLPLENMEVPKRCGTSADSVRPLRARLVGLLASLEEETSAFRGLLTAETPSGVEGRSLTLSKMPGRRTRDLPALNDDRRSVVSPSRADRSFKSSEESSITGNSLN